MKYREDMMENHEKGPGMRSDRPRITTNVLPLEVSSHMLDGKRDGGEMLLVGFGGEGKGHIYISQVWLTPLLCAVADCLRYPADRPPLKFLTDTRLELPLVNFSKHMRTVR